MMYKVVNNLVHRPLPNSVQQVSRMPNLAAQIILEKSSLKETKKKCKVESLEVFFIHCSSNLISPLCLIISFLPTLTCDLSFSGIC